MNHQSTMSQAIAVGEAAGLAVTDLIDSLVAHHAAESQSVAAVADTLEANTGVTRYFGVDTKVFNREHATKQLAADYWDKALKLTDVLDVMPEARRHEWAEQIRELETPPFEEEAVRSTLTALLQSRSRFFAERVEGIFRALSREHVTNAPQGFGKRMIIYAMDQFGYPDYKAAGHINDLRCVIARIMGREEPNRNATGPALTAARRQSGDWLSIDGGALRIRVYLKGTAHLEVNPDMAWRLNEVLAILYPSAIPEAFRTKPKRRKVVKNFELMDKILPPQVIACLAGAEPAVQMVGEGFRRQNRRITNSLRFSFHHTDKHVRQQAGEVLAAIGGVEQGRYWQFDYDPTEVIGHIAASGCIPDHKSHQYYPTPDWLAAEAVRLADIAEHHTVLEPSAGQGAIARQVPSANLTCVEVSDLHCRILRELGVTVDQADFLKWRGGLFDRVIMNPPFDGGRWLAHIEHAADMVDLEGKLVAILPAGAKKREVLPGWKLSWSQEYDNAFPGASVSVVLLLAERP